MDSKHVVIFDDDCAFCNSWVSFIQKNDRKKHFRLLGQRSKEGQFALDKYQLDVDIAKTVVYFYNDRLYIKSEACLQILKNLNRWTRIFYVLILVPKPIRDVVYDVVAKNRNRFIGKRKTCKLHYKQT